MKTISLYQVRFFSGNRYSNAVGFKSRLIVRDKAGKLVKRLKRSGVEAFMARMIVTVPKEAA